MQQGKKLGFQYIVINNAQIIVQFELRIVITKQHCNKQEMAHNKQYRSTK